MNHTIQHMSLSSYIPNLIEKTLTPGSLIWDGTGLKSSGFEFNSSVFAIGLIEDRELENKTGLQFDVLDKVYHSESMHEMEVNADLQGVDLCNPHVLLFLAKQTTYHHAFWPHTAKRFLAFKSILRHNKNVRESLKDGKLLTMLNDHLEAMLIKYNSNRVHDTIGRRQEIKNMRQVVSIVKKAIGIYA